MKLRLKDTVLIVGDKKSARAELRNIFSESYNLLEAENVAQATLLLEQNESYISVVLVDMAVIDTAKMRRLMTVAHAGTEKAIPVVMILDEKAGSEKEDIAFMLGATDVVLKPYSNTAILRRIDIMVNVFLNKWNLEKMVSEQSEKIRNANQAMLDALSAIIEHRSTESGNHILRIRRFTKMMLQEVARCCPEYELTEETIDIISSASALHDIGKISVPDAVLNKPGPLTKEEFEVMKGHSVIGSQLVRQLSAMEEELFLRYAYNIALYHHERWDGKGYPCGLKGDEIPICAQVVGLTDAFDALTTNRVYKPAYPYQAAINMLLNGECGMFSPKLLECFKHIREDIVALAKQYADGYSPKSDNISVPLPGPVWNHASFSSLQRSQAKYQALLHYIGDTVIELDVDNGIYQVVYNPDPVLDSIIPAASVKEISEKLHSAHIHPDDMPVLDEISNFFNNELLALKLRRKSFVLRIFSQIVGDYLGYELTFLRVNTGSDDRRFVTAIWHRTDASRLSQNLQARINLHSSPALYGLISSAVRCRSDIDFSIDDGAADLYPLTGFTEQDIEQMFKNKLINMVLPKDQPMFASAVKEALESGTKSEVEFRMLHKNGESVWVLSKFRSHVEQNGEEYIYFAIRDNSQSKKIQQQLATDIQRNQTLIDQSGSIVFDWDITTDTMYCSPKWEEHFGYAPVSEKYDSQLGVATHFHPDDLIHVREAIAQVRAGENTIVKEVRIANSEGKYLWTKITATGCRDEENNLINIIGILQDIDELKRSAIAMGEEASRDSLTKLLNKASCQRLISDYFSSADNGTVASLLILDLDNFKSVNDTRGHLFGDVVLTQVGTALRKMFRADDIIGRIGGDEFMVLLKNISGTDVLKERCQSLLDTLNILFENLAPDLAVSCSIGVALFPSHGRYYNELFLKADEALYQAKHSGKNQFNIYSADYKFTYDNSTHTTVIDSDDPLTVTTESFERFVFHSLYESRNIEATINNLISFVGSNLNVSRVYIFENNDDNTECSNTFEWCNEGIVPQKENLQNISYITDIPGWPDVYSESNVFYCTDITKLDPQYREILEPQGIKSMLHYAITDQGVFRGYIGFDDCVRNRLWTQQQMDQLKFLAEVLSVFLINRRGKK